MSVIITPEASSIVVEPGPYNMILDKLELVTGKFGQSLKWFWKASHAQHGEITLTMMSSARLTPATKAGRAYCVLNRGVSVKAGQPVDMEQFIGCVCQVHVENKTTDEGVTYSNVVEVLRLIDDSNSFIAAKRQKEESMNDVPFTDSGTEAQAASG
jgi:hypothetical protein